MMTTNKRDLEIYIHIPFCKQKCLYCDFLSFAGREGAIKDYICGLLSEISAKSSLYDNFQVISIYIGGGTPSLINSEYIESIMETIKKNFSLEKKCEISMELNPGTVSFDKLVAYKKAGINRLSIGLQSSDDDELKRIGRIHTKQDFLQTYKDAVKAGFSNINVDIMSALPEQNLDGYIKTLDFVTNLFPKPTHISAYSLIIEEGTPFFELNRKNKLLVPDEDEEREMYLATGEKLRDAGYERYEISNYSNAGFRCRHNVGYWRRIDYLGFGLGASSLIDNVRMKNETCLDKYIANPKNSIIEREVLSKKDQMEEFMFLGLRMMEGIKKSDFESTFEENLYSVYGKVIQKNLDDRLLIIKKLKGNDERIFLSSRGIDLSNYVFAQFLFD